jgi:hypothetical protein
MAKYEFEWTDEQAEEMQLLLVAAADNAPGGRLFFSNVAQRIEEQKPVPLPTKTGAVINFGGNRYVLVSPNQALWARLRQMGEFDGLRAPSDMPLSGFIVEYEGVDL